MGFIFRYFSRERLRDISSEYEEEIDVIIDEIICSFIFDLYRASRNGITSYLFDMTKYNQVSPGVKSDFSYPTSLDELLHEFQERFSGSKLTYKEDWVIDGIKKKGIMIDWA
jgi:hypothetical protein